jgi:hypothetical protein
MERQQEALQRAVRMWAEQRSYVPNHNPAPEDERVNLQAVTAAYVNFDEAKPRVKIIPASPELASAAGNSFVRFLGSLADPQCMTFSIVDETNPIDPARDKEVYNSRGSAELQHL